MQYVVVFQCILAQANMTAFFVDGSYLSNWQVRCSSAHILLDNRYIVYILTHEDYVQKVIYFQT